jgi:hypothetical protein
MTGKKTPAEKRREQREALWPNSDQVVWSPKQAKGFFSAPRTLSLVGTLIRLLSPKLDPSRVFFDLWARNFEEGIVEIGHEEDLAASSGYAEGSRSIRTWRERIGALEKLGFIRLKGSGTRKYAFVLLLHPDRVVATLRARSDLRIPEWWTSLYDQRLRETGAPTAAPFTENGA